ncbi:MAG: hypothetical protein AB7G28_25615 [Pirellulales bacterium]
MRTLLCCLVLLAASAARAEVLVGSVYAGFSDIKSTIAPTIGAYFDYNSPFGGLGIGGPAGNSLTITRDDSNAYYRNVVAALEQVLLTNPNFEWEYRTTGHFEEPTDYLTGALNTIQLAVGQQISSVKITMNPYSVERVPYYDVPPDLGPGAPPYVDPGIDSYTFGATVEVYAVPEPGLVIVAAGLCLGLVSWRGEALRRI